MVGVVGVRWELHSWKNCNKINKYSFFLHPVNKPFLCVFHYGFMYMCAIETCKRHHGKIDGFEELKVVVVLVHGSTSTAEPSPAQLVPICCLDVFLPMALSN